MSSASARTISSPSQSGMAAPKVATPSKPVALYTPAAIGWIAFFCTLPAGFVLAALNCRKAGQGRRGGLRLVGAFATLVLLWAVIGNAGALSGALSLALEIAGIIYLVRDARVQRRACRETIGVYDAPTTNALIIGIIVLVVTVALMVGYVSRVIG
jgi:hypothetical protein